MCAATPPLAVGDRLRRQVPAEAGDRCDICGGRGRRWPVECHEVRDYDDQRKVQRLDGLRRDIDAYRRLPPTDIDLLVALQAETSGLADDTDWAALYDDEVG